MAKRKLSEDTLLSITSKKSRVEHGSFSPSDKPSPDPLETSALLRLPSELRNKIYVYVLTADGGLLKLTPQYDLRSYLVYGKKSRLPFRQYYVSLDKFPPEFNHMKFACRTLWEETACLESTYNTLVLERLARHEMEPTEQLLEFERLCSPIKFSWIKRIELHIKALAMPGSEILRYFLNSRPLDTYVRAAQWCHQHPDVDVKYVFISFTWHSCYHLGSPSEGFSNQGIVLLKTLRNRDVGY